jgi:two-component system phosphate regulon response regulator PhoB
MTAVSKKAVSAKKILIVEDDADIAELISINLAKEKYEVKCVFNGYDAIDMTEEYMPDLVLLDIMLPDESGFEVCKALKKNPITENIPIIMVTAKTEDADIVTGLELGAEDYIVKPFSLRVLVARVNKILRKKSEKAVSDKEATKIHNLIIDPVKHEVSVSGKQIDLTLSEFKLLQILAQKAGRVYSRSQLIGAIRGDEYVVTGRSIDVLIVNLRKKLGKIGEKIITVRGVGYKMLEY